MRLWIAQDSGIAQGHVYDTGSPAVQRLVGPRRLVERDLGRRQGRQRQDVERRRRAAAALLADLPLPALATTEFAFDDAARAYEALDRRDPGVVHVALRYP